jgi:hypothetical protein
MFTESRRRGLKRFAHTPIPKALSLCFVDGDHQATDRKVLQPSRGLSYRFFALLFIRYKKIPFQQRQHNVWAVWRCLSLRRPALSVDRSSSYHIGGSNERARARAATLFPSRSSADSLSGSRGGWCWWWLDLRASRTHERGQVGEQWRVGENRPTVISLHH